MTRKVLSKELKEDYYVKQDSFNTYLAEVEKSMVTKAGRDAYNQILADLDGYWELSDELIEIGATTDEAGKARKRRIGRSKNSSQCMRLFTMI